MATVTLEVDSLELWEAFWGSGFESDPVTRNWLMNVEYLDNTRWDNIGTVRLWFIPENGDDDDEKFWGDDYQKHCASKDVTLADIESALSKAMKEGYHHVPCGGKIDTNFEEWDACVSDILLQLIAYGKEVWA